MISNTSGKNFESESEALRRCEQLMQQLQHLQARESRFRSVIENVKDVVFQTDVEGNWTYLNPSWTELLGYPVEESLGKPFLSFVNPEDHEKNRAEFVPLIERLKPYCRHEVRYIAQDGTDRWIEVFARLTLDSSDRTIGTSGILRDMTQRKAMELELSSQNAILDAAQDFISRATLDGRLLYCNKALRDFLGVSAEQVTSLTIRNLLSPAAWDRLDVPSALSEFIKAGYWRGEVEYVSGKGEIVPVSLNVMISRDADGTPLYQSAIARDIREQTAAAAQLALARARLEEAQRVARMGSCDVDLATGTMEWSPQLYALMERDPKLGPPSLPELRANFLLEDSDRFESSVNRCLTEGIGYEFTGRRVAKDGDIRTYRIVGSPVLDAAGRIVRLTHICIDVTEQQRLETQLRHVQKMDTIGKFAGSIAHDFNNLLGAILGHAEEIADSMEPGNVLYAGIQNIQNAATRAANLTGQLLAFAHKQAINPVIVNANDLLKETAMMLKPLIGSEIELVCRFSPEAGSIHIDSNQLEQVVVNLFVNARDAMPAGGQLTLETGVVNIAAGDPEGSATLSPGRYTVITIADTGTGMSPEVKERLFEPFFTTKPKGKGTGLGLATVFSIVQQNQGEIRVESEMGVGTRVDVYFPQVPNVHMEPQASQPTIHYQHGAGTILIVDDEPMLRTIACTALRKKGYVVLEANDGVEAMQILTANPGMFNMLITDATMPRMNGPELIVKVRESWPEIVLLLISGYSEDVFDGIKRDIPVQLLQKPFKVKDLTRTVYELLAKDLK